jgi:hypothetical protein
MLMSYIDRYIETSCGEDFFMLYVYEEGHVEEEEPQDLSHVYGWLMVLGFAGIDMMIICEALK